MERRYEAPSEDAAGSVFVLGPRYDDRDAIGSVYPVTASCGGRLWEAAGRRLSVHRSQEEAVAALIEEWERNY
jgi:hypothetical protein